ncbi:unnamed protein product, partial [Ectocarpus sp. 13 AM-2016]
RFLPPVGTPVLSSKTTPPPPPPPAAVLPRTPPSSTVIDPSPDGPLSPTPPCSPVELSLATLAWRLRRSLSKFRRLSDSAATAPSRNISAWAAPSCALNRSRSSSSRSAASFRSPSALRREASRAD